MKKARRILMVSETGEVVGSRVTRQEYIGAVTFYNANKGFWMQATYSGNGNLLEKTLKLHSDTIERLAKKEEWTEEEKQEAIKTLKVYKVIEG